jgi:hypothetical protein
MTAVSVSVSAAVIVIDIAVTVTAMVKKRSQGSFFVLLSLLSFRLLPAFF